MDCGRLVDGLRWSAYTFDPTDLNKPSASTEEVCGSVEQNADTNYLITYPDDESESSSFNKESLGRSLNEPSKLNRYVNPLFISGEVLKGEITDDGDVEELMKNEAKKLEDYKFCEAVNDFDIELESGEAVPIVYLSSTRAAKLQRALRLSGLKKVRLLYYFV